MTLSELLAEQRRCANRLYDEFYQQLYLAIQKEINERASVENLDISGFDIGSGVSSKVNQ